MLKKLSIAALACVVLLAGALGAIHWTTKAGPLRVLVLHGGESDTYLDALQHLSQTLVVGVRTEHAAWPVGGGKLKRYDAVYLDRSLAANGADAGLSKAVDQYAREGGILFVENELHGTLPKELLGAESFAPLERLPEGLELGGTAEGKDGAGGGKSVASEAAANAGAVRTVVLQFHRNLTQYYNKERLAALPLGVAMKPSTALPLAQGEDGAALYALNRHGKGYVLFSGGLLPGSGYATGFDLLPREGSAEPYFNFMFATGGYLLRNAFVDFVAKEKLGYSVTKVLGTYGRPAMAWQNHFEVSTSVRDGGMELWIEYLKQHNQIPSYSLARETYDWGVWKEGLAYYPNEGSARQPSFEGETADSQYSSGHIVQMADGGPFSLAPYPDFRSLSEQIGLPYRTYVDALDIDGDGALDVVAGSATGEVLLFAGTELDGKWALEAARPLLLASGGELRVDSYAAPALVDLNGDGLADLIVGDGDGRLRAYWNEGEFVFREAEEALPAGLDGRRLGDLEQGAGSSDREEAVGAGTGAGGDAAAAGSPSAGEVGGEGDGVADQEQEGEERIFAAPAADDWDGDGVPDLVIGFGDGSVYLLAGSMADGGLQFASSGLVELLPPQPDGTRAFAAPRIADFDGDGVAELLVGGNDGFVRLYRAHELGQAGTGTSTGAGTGEGIGVDESESESIGEAGGSFAYIEGKTLNPFGDNRLWGGRNAVPVMADVNGDGLNDLLVGQLIFGFPTAIDDPGFPYREELVRSLDYAKRNFIDIQPHLFFHSYESAEREAEEMALHRKAFEAYGLPWAPSGTNQHTWRVNNLVPDQTIREEMKAGLWWNSGFRPGGNPYEPTLSGEYLWTMPFLLMDGDRPNAFVVANPAPNKAVFEDAYESYAALDLPFTYFYHMEYPILKPESEGGYADKVEFLDRFRSEHDYNFMTEEQMFRSYMAAYQADASLATPLLKNVRYTLENAVRTKRQMAVAVRTGGLREMNWAHEPDEALQQAIRDYLPAVGYKVELGSKYKGYVPVTDAPVTMYRNGALYFGGSDEATVTIQPNRPAGPRIERINMPARIERDGGLLRIEWLGQGLQQVKLYAPQGIMLGDGGEEWSIEEGDEGIVWTLTRFGDATTLEVRLK